MDWKEKMARLKAAGLTQTQIADKCGVRQSTISDIAQGITKQPKYAIGVKLQELVDELPADARPAQGGVVSQHQAA